MLGDGADHAEDDGDAEDPLERGDYLGGDRVAQPDVGRLRRDVDREEEGGGDQRADQKRQPAKTLGAGKARGESRGWDRLFDDRVGRAEAERFPGLREDQADEDQNDRERDGTDRDVGNERSGEPDAEPEGRTEPEDGQGVPRADAIRDRSAGIG